MSNSLLFSITTYTNFNYSNLTEAFSLFLISSWVCKVKKTVHRLAKSARKRIIWVTLKTVWDFACRAKVTLSRGQKVAILAHGTSLRYSIKIALDTIVKERRGWLDLALGWISCLRLELSFTVIARICFQALTMMAPLNARAF